MSQHSKELEEKRRKLEEMRFYINFLVLNIFTFYWNNYFQKINELNIIIFNDKKNKKKKN